jgi:hypothetical protein
MGITEFLVTIMKKRFLFITLLLMALSCEQVETDLIEREITVFHAISGDGEETKTVLKEGGQIWWMPEDAIKLFWSETEQGRTGIEMVSNNAEASSSVDFICPASFDGNSASTFWAVYPSNTVESFSGESVVISIPSQQVAQEGTFANHFFPSVANSTDSYLRFYNVCGGIKFSVVRDDIKSVTFEGNNNEELAGRVKLVIGNGGYPEVVEVLEGATSITLVAPDNGFFKPGKYYYLSVLPTKLQNGFSFMFNTTNHGGKLKSSDAKSIKRSVFGVLEEIDSRNDASFEAIDLGLSVNWASVNLGATEPEGFGNYYAWGETEPNKTTYSWSSYKWASSESNLYKYNSSDYKTALDVEDDAARAFLGEGWRMPTKAELEELKNGCTWTKKTVNGVVGYEGISKKTGNSIFLPMCGVFRESAIKEIGQTGIYWSSDLAAKKYMAESLYMMADKTPRMGQDERRYGYSIRAVSVKESGVSVTSVTLNMTSLTLTKGQSETLIATVSPDNTADKIVTWSSTNPSVATVDQNGVVTGVQEGESTIIASAGSVTARCQVYVRSSVSQSQVVLEQYWTLDNGLFVDDHGKPGPEFIPFIFDAPIKDDNYKEVIATIGRSGSRLVVKVRRTITFEGIVTSIKRDPNVDIYDMSGPLLYKAYCYPVTAMKLPSSIVELGENLFQGFSMDYFDCSESVGLERIGGNLFINGSCQRVLLPDFNCLEEIGEYAFVNSVFSAIDFSHNKVPLEIGKYAFKNVPLESVTLGTCVIKHLNDGVFSGTKIKTIDLSASSDYIDYIGNQAFLNTGLESFDWTLLPKLRQIGASAFNNTALEEIDLSANNYLRLIGASAFAYTPLKNCKLPSFLESLSAGLFSGDKLECLDISLCTRLTEIGDGALSNCAISTLVLPNARIKRIGKQSFYQCSINELDFSQYNELEEIGEEAFHFALNINKISLPASISKIGKSAFRYTGIKEIDLSACENLTTIPNAAFEGSKINKIYLPKSVSRIEYCAFFKSSLYYLMIPDGSELNYIGQYAFKWAPMGNLDLSNAKALSIIDQSAFGFTGLRTIVLPESVTTLGKDVVTSCENLVSFYIKATIPPSLSTLGTIRSDLHIYVPQDSWGDYRKAPGWKEYVLTKYDFNQ